MLLATARIRAANLALGLSAKPAITRMISESKRCPPRALLPAALIKAPAFISALVANAAAGARQREGFALYTSLAQQWAELQSLRKNWPPLFSQSSQSYGPISRTS
jgi:hypothetical protein